MKQTDTNANPDPGQPSDGFEHALSTMLDRRARSTVAAPDVDRVIVDATSGHTPTWRSGRTPYLLAVAASLLLIVGGGALLSNQGSGRQVDPSHQLEEDPAGEIGDRVTTTTDRNSTTKEITTTGPPEDEANPVDRGVSTPAGPDEANQHDPFDEDCHAAGDGRRCCAGQLDISCWESDGTLPAGTSPPTTSTQSTETSLTVPMTPTHPQTSTGEATTTESPTTTGDATTSAPPTSEGSCDQVTTIPSCAVTTTG